MKMAKRLNWTNEELNSYGFWVKTDGIMMDAFDKNPIMLFNHHRTFMGKKDEILPTGKWEDYKKENSGEMTGVPVFDMNDDFAAKIGNKVENGFLTACSIGISIIETSDDPQYLKAGQTHATVTKCILKEVSVVDIPANPNAAGIVLYDENDKVVNLSDNGFNNIIPLINNKNDNKMKQVLTKLGLPENASEAEALSAVIKLKETADGELLEMKKAKEQVETELKRLTEVQKTAEKEEAKSIVADAVLKGKISSKAQDDYLALFDLNFAHAKKIVQDLTPRTKLSDALNSAGKDTSSLANLSWDELDKKGLLKKLKDEDPELYKTKYAEMAASIRIGRN